ncbi:MAG: glycosyltransferase family 2 protein [Thermoanaerobaculia bacterium]
MIRIAAGAALFWLGCGLWIDRIRRRAPRLPDPLPDPPPTTILLPVRDEARHLVACLATLGEQGAVAIRVVDDGSTDATPALLAECAAADPRIEAISAPPPPERWTGKVNALAAGLPGVATPWVLLTDADTRHAPALLARAHAAAAEHRLDALSLAGSQEARGCGENLLTPAVFALLDALLGDWRAHATGGSATALANGQYFLVRTAALEAAGGFAAIVGQPLDDVALARALRAAGFRTGFRPAPAALRTRMYQGFVETFRGWRRNLALLLAGRTSIVAVLLGLALLAVAVPIVLAVAGDGSAALIAWLGGVAGSYLVRRSSRNPGLAAFCFPLDLVALAATATVATVDRRRGRLASWRGRVVGP